MSSASNIFDCAALLQQKLLPSCVLDTPDVLLASGVSCNDLPLVRHNVALLKLSLIIPVLHDVADAGTLPLSLVNLNKSTGPWVRHHHLVPPQAASRRPTGRG